MSPRRSSRARPALPSNSASHTRSSTSSMSSARADRQTRSHTKATSPPKVSTPRSRSSEENREPPASGRSDQLQTRRQKRVRHQKDDELERHPSRSMEREAVDEEDEGEDVTRCVCGQLEYPGPPFPVIAHPRSGSKDGSNPHSPLETLDAPVDDFGSFFIQCDTCKVWQHGGCVGIAEGSMSADSEYFCELCRQDLHQIVLGSKGLRSSRYLPVIGPVSAKASRSVSLSKDSTPKYSKAKAGAQSRSMAFNKRRSTMNSRDAAYDEEEQLRRAIEASKAEKVAGGSLGTDRKGKRERSESEDTRQGPIKRRRTTSESASSASHLPNAAMSQALESDVDDHLDKSSVHMTPRRVRNTTARYEQEKELRDRVAERDKEREEAAGRRKGRAERRRAEDSDPSADESPHSQPPFTVHRTGSNTSQPRDTLATNKPEKDTASSHAQTTNPTVSHRKTGRPQARRGRVGRNQYTKDRDLLRESNSRREASAATVRSQSRDDWARRDDLTKGNMAATGPHHSSSASHQAMSTIMGNADSATGSSINTKPSRPRHMNPQRTTMNDMKRRVAAILEFISRIQVEMAGENTPPSAAAALIKGIMEEIPKITLVPGSEGPQHTPTQQQPQPQKSKGKHQTANADNNNNNDNNNDNANTGVLEKDFAELSSMEMMDVLTRKLVLWQKEYGKWGEK